MLTKALSKETEQSETYCERSQLHNKQYFMLLMQGEIKYVIFIRLIAYLSLYPRKKLSMTKYGIHRKPLPVLSM